MTVATRRAARTEAAVRIAATNQPLRRSNGVWQQSLSAESQIDTPSESSSGSSEPLQGPPSLPCSAAGVAVSCEPRDETLRRRW
jgi:hypothetical protein